MSDRNIPSNLRLAGVGRAADDGEPFTRRVLELHFDRAPTDDELRAVHEHMRTFAAPVKAPAGLRVLADEYLDTLDASDRDERYTSDRGFASIGIDGLLEWLKGKGAVETSVATDHAANLAKALDCYLDAHDMLSGVQSADEATGGNDAADCGFIDKANDAWRALRAALHEYRKHSPVKSTGEPQADKG